jgi:signal transduction histidine kinase
MLGGADMTKGRITPPWRESQQRRASSDVDIFAIAHEMRNSLSIISGLVELCVSHMGVKEPPRLEAEAILKEIDRCTNALNLLLSKRKRGARRLTPSYLSEVTEGVVSSMIPLFAHKGVSLSWHSKGSLPPLQCEPWAIESVLVNLLKNSLEATERGGEVKVEIFSSPSEEVIVVSDNGCGISGENLKRIFEMGFSTKPNGAGAGLSLCKEIVERHNGTITVDSEKGIGTAVTLRFPLSTAPLRQEKAKENSS